MATGGSPLCGRGVFDGCTAVGPGDDGVAAGEHWQRALDLFNGTSCEGICGVCADAALFSMAIVACQEGAQWEAAVHLLDQMPPSEPQQRLPGYGAGCSACERGGQWLRALELADALEREGLRCNVVIYGTSLSAFGRGFRWTHALQLLRLGSLRSVQMNIITYTAACAATEKAQRWRWAMQLFAGTGWLTLETNVLSFSAVTSACAEHGQWQVALLVNEMADGNDYTFNAMLRAAQRGSAWQRAWWLYNKGEDSVDSMADVVSLSATCQACDGHLASAAVELRDNLRRASAADGNQEVLVLDLLATFDCLDTVSQQRFLRRRVQPVLKRLGSPSAERVALDPLTLQYSLGESFTTKVLTSPRSFAGGELVHPFLSSARGALRRASSLALHGPVILPEPTAMAMAAWSSAAWKRFSGSCATGKLEKDALCAVSEVSALRARPVGHGGRHQMGRSLTPVLVEHERLWHAERHALLLLLSQIRGC